MKKNDRFIAVDVLFFLGAILISVGVGLWAHAAAGLVAAGCFCVLASFLVDTEHQGNGGEKHK